MHPAVIATMLLSGIFGVAIVAEVLSQKANTQNVLSSAGTALSSVITAATSPITGQSANVGNTLATTQPTTINV